MLGGRKCWVYVTSEHLDNMLYNLESDTFEHYVKIQYDGTSWGRFMIFIDIISMNK